MGCNNNSTVVESKSVRTDSVGQGREFGGVFTGTTPCADCPGIYTVVAFQPNGKFLENLNYFERNTQFADSGKWTINDSMITVVYKKGSNKRYYQHMNDSLIRMLDGDRQPIQGPLEQFYILKKKDTVLQR